MSIPQLIAFTIYLVLQGVIFFEIIRKNPWKTSSSINKKLLYSIFLVIYLCFNFLNIFIILFYKSIAWWVREYSLESLLYAIIIFAIIMSSPALYFIFTYIFKKHDSGSLPVDENKRGLIKKIALSGLALGVPITYSMYKGIKDLEITSLRLPLKDCPKSFVGYKIVQISDIHCSAFIRGDYLSEVIHQVNNLAGDLLVLTGDYLTGMNDRKYFPEFLEALKKVDSRYSISAVLGNHEFWENQDDYVEQALTNAGVRVLRNSHQVISRGGENLYLVGIDDITFKRDDIQLATSGVPLDKLTVLLSHNPDFIPTASKYSFSLMLSGHTHGGQVQLPFIGPVIVPSRFGRRYAEGLHKMNDSYLYVNRGIGVISPPIRFLCRPEITKITLDREVT
ncbi:MAG: metallophosphoesterase [Spirochaetota bacterium]|nr:metallophosphoesterase [Spirochaetota bacterium]